MGTSMALMLAMHYARPVQRAVPLARPFQPVTPATQGITWLPVPALPALPTVSSVQQVGAPSATHPQLSSGPPATSAQIWGMEGQ